MIHTSRIITVGDQESSVNSPIILYRGDREVEVEFTINGHKFMFTNGGNVIKSTNATHGQLVINTPTGENMFSEVSKCYEGKILFVITKEMIDELDEVGFYDFQVRLFDGEELTSRVTMPPVHKGIDIRNPIASEEEEALKKDGKVDEGTVNYAKAVESEPIADTDYFDDDGNYVKTIWNSGDLITQGKLNKIEGALNVINNKAANDSGNTNIDLSNYATKDEIPSIEGLATETYVKNEIANAQLGGDNSEIDLSNYVTKDDLSNYATKDNLSQKVDKSEVPTKISQLENDSKYLTSIPSEYITTSELESKGYLTEHQDLSNYATKNEVPSIEGLATENYVKNKIASAQLEGVDAEVDLSGFASKDDLKSVELYIRDDLSDSEDASVKLARAVISSILSKPDSKRYTITYKYMCNGSSIKEDTTETAEEGTTKSFNTISAPTIDGYEVSSVSPTSARINSDITVTYTYIKICVHNYIETVTKQPSCTEKGIKSYTCSECGHSYTEEIPMLEHVYTETITKQATCKETGIKTYTCELCGHSYTEEIPKEQHEYVNEVCVKCGDHVHKYVEEITKQPTCTEDGIKTFACSECEDSYTETIPMLGHSYTETITKQATCTEDGVKTHACSCGHSYTTTISKLGHNYVGGVCTNCGDSEFPVDPDTGAIDITSLFDFTKHTKMTMNLGTLTGTTGNFKSSSYFDSAVADLSAYAGKTIKIMIPAYNSSTGGNACNCTCLVNDNYPTATKPSLKTILHRWEVYSGDTSVKALGEYREYTIVLPSDTKYFLTTIFSPDSLNKCVGSTEFYCKVIL